MILKIKVADSGISVAGKRWLAVTVLFVLCSFLSKEQGITVVAVCVVYDAFCIQKVLHLDDIVDTRVQLLPVG